MQDRIKDDILKALDKALLALAEKDSNKLRGISDQTVHNASIFQDKDSISIAVVMYALSKIIDRMATIEPRVVESLQKARDNLAHSEFDSYSSEIKNLIDVISKFDKKLNLYIQKVITEAEIKKGSKLYEHGISLAQTAVLLGISQWELMKYIGQTSIAEGFDDGISAKDRLDHTRRLFN